MNMKCFGPCSFQIKSLFLRFCHGYGLRLLPLRLQDLKFWFRVLKYLGNIDADFGMSCCTTATVLQEESHTGSLWPCTEAGPQKGIFKSKQPFILGFMCRTVLLHRKIPFSLSCWYAVDFSDVSSDTPLPVRCRIWFWHGKILTCRAWHTWLKIRQREGESFET